MIPVEFFTARGFATLYIGDREESSPPPGFNDAEPYLLVTREDDECLPASVVSAK